MADDGAGDEAAAREALFGSQLGARQERVRSLLRAQQPAEALRAALADPPLASKDAALKQANFELIMQAVQACAAKEAQMALFLESLCDADSADYLMKVVYRGLKTPDASALLLRLHAQLLEKAGMGCIVRAIVDRQTA
jgi:actin related protein 2/3 complex subunit 5